MTRVREMIERHEGRRTRPYKDSRGILTVGVGRNLDVVPLIDDEIDLMLTNDITRAYAAARSCCISFGTLGEARQAVLVDMAFNLGATGLRAFRSFLAAIDRGDWKRAGEEMERSFWWKQVGERAHELRTLIELGQFPEDVV